jgi:hypothetical protein
MRSTRLAGLRGVRPDARSFRPRDRFRQWLAIGHPLCSSAPADSFDHRIASAPAYVQKNHPAISTDPPADAKPSHHRGVAPELQQSQRIVARMWQTATSARNAGVSVRAEAFLEKLRASVRARKPTFRPKKYDKAKLRERFGLRPT